MSCPVCEAVKDACDKMGDKPFCEQVIEDYYASKIDEKQLMNKIISRFGEKALDKVRTELLLLKKKEA